MRTIPFQISTQYILACRKNHVKLIMKRIPPGKSIRQREITQSLSYYIEPLPLINMLIKVGKLVRTGKGTKTSPFMLSRPVGA